MQQNNLRQSNHSEEELGFFEILRILLNSKRLIILITIAVGAIGLIYSYYFNPVKPPNYNASAVMEIGSYPAPDEMLSNSRDGRILIASMEASTALLNAVYGMNNPRSNDIIQRVTVKEIDSQYLTIEVDGLSIDSVKVKINEIIGHLKALHVERLDEVLSKKKRELQNIEEKLLTIDKFINFIAKDNDIYTSDVAELKLKEIDYKFKLEGLNMQLSNMQSFRKTDLVEEIIIKTNYPKSNTIKLTFASFIMGFVLSSLFVFIRYGFINNYEE